MYDCGASTLPMASVKQITLEEIEVKKNVQKLVQKYCNALAENFAKQGWKRTTVRVLYKGGRKYFRVLVRYYVDGKFDHDCVLAFVDFKGDVYMSGSRHNCAKGVRYNITKPKCILLDSKFTDCAGGHLYMHTVKKYRK